MEYPQAFWNHRYSGSDYTYGTEPNLYFKTQLDAIETPGRLLLLCEGEGRNAVYAAKQGWQVTAVDFSEIARKKALDLAEAHQVRIDYILSDIESFPFDKHGPWDMIALIFAHFTPDIRLIAHKKCAQALAPSGRLVLEGFNRQQFGRFSGGPKNPEMLYSKSMLEEDFKGLEVLDAIETTALLNEGEGHTGLGQLVRFTAEKGA